MGELNAGALGKSTESIELKNCFLMLVGCIIPQIKKNGILKALKFFIIYIAQL